MPLHTTETIKNLIKNHAFLDYSSRLDLLGDKKITIVLVRYIQNQETWLAIFKKS